MTRIALRFFVIYLVINIARAVSGQTIGIAKVPIQLRKATILVEGAETRTNTKYIPVGISIPVQGKTIQITPTNWVTPIEQPETTFSGIGSGVLFTKWGVNFFATAKHVVSANENV